MAQAQVEGATRVEGPAPAARAAMWVRAGARRWDWLRHWEFWLALVLGGFLRLWHIELTQFLYDQASLMRLARDAVAQHALPVTGMPFSIGIYNPPLIVYLLIPFALFSASPLPYVVAQALVDTAAVVVCYVFTLRYFGRALAAAATLLFATSGTAVLYSRFMWQPNPQPVLALLWACAVFAGCVRGARGWLVPSTILLVMAILLHPIAMALVPVEILAVVLAPAAPRLREYVVSALCVFALLVPTLIFELVSHGYDFTAYQQYAHGRSVSDPTVLQLVWAALAVGDIGNSMRSSPLAAMAGVFPIVSQILQLLAIAGFIMLTVRVLRPFLGPRPARPSAHHWQRLLTDPAWRAHLLLWLWLTLPLAALVQHTSPPQVHYLLITYPALFIVTALPVARLVEIARLHMPGLAMRRASGGRPASAVGWSVSPSLRLAARYGLGFATAGLLAVVLVAQLDRNILNIAVLADGRYVAYDFNGYPIPEMQAADHWIAQLQRDHGATSVIFSAPQDPRYRTPLDYLLVREHLGRIEVAESCLLLPAPDAGTALVVSTETTTPAVVLLSRLPNAERIADIPLAGGAPWPVFKVGGTAPALGDEMDAGGAVFDDANGGRLRLDAVAPGSGGMVRLRWTVLASGGGTQPLPWYRIIAHATDGQNGPPTGAVDCQPNRWRAGETLFTWLSLVTSTGAAPTGTLGTITVGVQAGTLHEDLEWFGPLLVLSARDVGTPLVPLHAVAPARAPGVETPQGGYTLALPGSTQP